MELPPLQLITERIRWTPWDNMVDTNAVERWTLWNNMADTDAVEKQLLSAFSTL